jgi:hypothetical protein
MIHFKDLEGNGCDLSEGGNQVNYIRIVGVPAEIRTERPSYTSQKHCRYTDLFDHT